MYNSLYRQQCMSVFFFNDTATTEIYTLPYTTLFRSDLRETGEELLDGHRVRSHARPSFQVARETDLHAVHLQRRLYPREPTGPTPAARGLDGIGAEIVTPAVGRGRGRDLA